MNVICEKITKDQIYFVCPVCSKYTFRNGKLRKIPYKKIHIHGNDNNFSNRIETRSPHCVSSIWDYTGDFSIHITDDTIKIK